MVPPPPTAIESAAAADTASGVEALKLGPTITLPDVSQLKIGKLPVALLRDRVFTRFFDPADREERATLVKALKASKAMFQAAAPGIYQTPPFPSLSYATTKRMFTDAILKTDDPKRIKGGRMYGAYVRILDLTRATHEFGDKKVTDNNVHRVFSLCPLLQRVAIPFSRRPLDVAKQRSSNLYPQSDDPNKSPTPSRKPAVPSKAISSDDFASLDANVDPNALTAPGSQPNEPGLTDRALRSLARTAKNGHLRSIQLGNIHDFTPEALEHLFANAPGLHTVKLQARFAEKSSLLGSQVVDALVGKGVANRLRELHLTEVTVSELAWAQLMKASAKSLRGLHLSGIPVTRAMLQTLSEGPMSKLTHFSIHMDGISDPSHLPNDDSLSLVVPHMSQLRNLGLHSVPVSDKAFKNFAVGKGNTLPLESLSICLAELKDPMALADTILARCPHLGWVDFGGNVGLRQNRKWARVFNLDEDKGSEADPETGEEPWWMEDSEDLTMGPRRLKEIRECAAKRNGAGK